MARTPKRKEFLTDILITAIECGPYGFFYVDEYNPDADEPFADIVDKEDEGEGGKPERFHVDLDVLAKGLGVIRDAIWATTPTEIRYLTFGEERVPYEVGGETVLHNAKTFERLYMSEEQRKNIMLADRTNHEEGDLDVIDALAILECGLFGSVVYG